MTDIVAVDIGGTHARFAIAEVAAGRIIGLRQVTKLKTGDHSGLKSAWRAFAEVTGHALPRDAAIAVACPVGGEILAFANNPWIIRPASIDDALGVDRHILINDFGAVAHAVAQLGNEHLRAVCGPDRPLPAEGVVSVIGPGTGLGVAQLIRFEDRYHVTQTEGGHGDFAPLDAFEDRLLAQLRGRFRRVSVERVVAGPGLTAFYGALSEGGVIRDDKELWAAAISGSDEAAAAALERYCLSLGAVAGDIALVQGATAVVVAGGIGLRLADYLAGSGFEHRFVAKGRFEAMMRDIPVKVMTHPEPGLFGAAAAFAAAYPT